MSSSRITEPITNAERWLGAQFSKLAYQTTDVLDFLFGGSYWDRPTGTQWTSSPNDRFGVNTSVRLAECVIFRQLPENERSVIVVAFRGTTFETPVDLLHDILTLFSTAVFAPPRGMFAEGAFLRWQPYAARVKERLAALASGSGQTVLVTGHSLGAMEAILAAPQLRGGANNFNVRLVTVAAPACYTEDFGNGIADLPQAHLRSPNDPLISTIPLLTNPYIWMFSDGPYVDLKQAEVVPADSHGINDYVACLTPGTTIAMSRASAPRPAITPDAPLATLVIIASFVQEGLTSYGDEISKWLDLGQACRLTIGLGGDGKPKAVLPLTDLSGNAIRTSVANPDVTLVYSSTQGKGGGPLAGLTVGDLAHVALRFADTSVLFPDNGQAYPRITVKLTAAEIIANTVSLLVDNRLPVSISSDVPIYPIHVGVPHFNILGLDTFYHQKNGNKSLDQPWLAPDASSESLLKANGHIQDCYCPPAWWTGDSFFVRSFLLSPYGTGIGLSTEPKLVGGAIFASNANSSMPFVQLYGWGVEPNPDNDVARYPLPGGWCYTDSTIYGDRSYQHLELYFSHYGTAQDSPKVIGGRTFVTDVTSKKPFIEYSRWGEVPYKVTDVPDPASDVEVLFSHGYCQTPQYGSSYQYTYLELTAAVPLWVHAPKVRSITVTRIKCHQPSEWSVWTQSGADEVYVLLDAQRYYPATGDVSMTAGSELPIPSTKAPFDLSMATRATIQLWDADAVSSNDLLYEFTLWARTPVLDTTARKWSTLYDCAPGIYSVQGVQKDLNAAYGLEIQVIT